MSHAKRLMVAVNEGVLDCMDVLEALTEGNGCGII